MHDDISVERNTSLPDERSLLVVERDPMYVKRIVSIMETRGFDVMCIASDHDAMHMIRTSPPAFAIIDIHPGRLSGLDVLQELASRRPLARSIVISGYDNITTAVRCIKRGAIDYLPKLVDANEICSVLLVATTGGSAYVFEVMSCRRFTWEYVWRIYELCDRNVSGSARKLGVRRRSLQRLLSEQAPR